MIKRALETIILHELTTSKKIIILYGPRQVGKTTLLSTLIKQTPYRTLMINADEPRYRETFGSQDLRILQGAVTGYDCLVIDEAQRIPDIGINLKILHDNIPTLKILVTGSSSFELANHVHEPLTGRAWSFVLYPIAFTELQVAATPFELNEQLPERLVFGSYPEIFSYPSYEQKELYLRSILESYLFKDLLNLATIKHPTNLLGLLKLLAYQIGNQVSLTELGAQLGMHSTTVQNYIDLLEQSFIIFRLSGFARNLRKELRKMDKIYFYDLGVRNAVIDNMKPITDRNDGGQLWENFLMIERIKYFSYTRSYGSRYFWRTHTGAELDLVEDRDGKLSGYEFKWGEKIGRTPHTFLATYPGSTTATINKTNYLSFITGK